MNILNWKNVNDESKSFKTQQPFKFGFIKNIFEKEFYEKLYETYPKINDFNDGSDMSKSQLFLQWR